MEKVLPSFPSSKSLLVGLAFVMIMSSCHKEKDECVKPNTTQQQSGSTARSMRGETNGWGTSTDVQKPVVGYRNAEVIDTEDPDGTGISDDGQDEADGESSTKKSRLNNH